MSTTAIATHYQILCDFMQQAEKGFGPETRTEIESFFAYCREGMDTDSEKLLATLLIKALNQRINSEFIGENIYLGKYEISQIQLFNILIEKFPFVRCSQEITNSAIVEDMKGATEVTLIDIGIGQGTQMLNIIERAKALPALQKLHIIGIEPFGDALKMAETTIMACNSQAPFEITFTGHHAFVEQMDLTTLGPLPGKVIVNASLALHHIQSAEKRMNVIAQVKALQPAAFVLIEPNSNHYEPDFYQRFQSCYRHFYSIFQVIDRIENIEQSDKNALKLFFGREIQDIIGKEEKDRYEKHELATRWIERLKANQFQLRRDFMQPGIEAGCEVRIAYHPEGYLGFTFKDETVLAVMYAN